MPSSGFVESIDRVLFWRQLGRRSRRRAVWAVAVVAGVGAALAGAEPTGLLGVDQAYSAFAAALVTWCVAHASRWTWPVIAAGAAFLAEGPWLVVGLLALVVSFLSIQEVKRDRVLGAVVGALAVQGLFRIPTDTVGFAVPTMIAAGTALPAVGSALWTMRGSRRRRVFAVAAGACGLSLLFFLLAGVALLAARTDVRDATAQARAALADIRADDRDTAVTRFETAAAEFDSARARVQAPWVAVGRVVPVLSHQLDAIDDLAGLGADLASTSAATIEELDLDSLDFEGGRIDLDRVATLEAPAATVVEETASAIERIDEIRSGWLAPQLVSRMDALDEELRDALPTLRNTVDGVRAAPWLLGADGERRYLVLFTTPAESRELGGFVGAYGILSADEGRLEFDGEGSSGPLSARLRTETEPSLPDIPLTSAFRLFQPEAYPQAWSGTADFPTGAAVAQHAYESLEPDVDGVLLADPYALAAMLEFTGPVDIPGLPRLTTDNAIDFLLRDQYLDFEIEEQGERKDLLVDVGEAVFDALVSGSLPSPPVAAEALGSVVADRRLLFVVDDAPTNDLFERIGLTGSIRPQPGQDAVTVVDSNLRANKLDAYIDRSVTVDALNAQNGSLTGTITVTIENNVPVTGLNSYVTGDGQDDDDGFPAGDHFMFTAVYTTLQVSRVTVDGDEVPFGREEAYGMNRYAAITLVPARASVDVVFEIDDERDPNEPFTLDWIPYASANGDEVAVNITRR